MDHYLTHHYEETADRSSKLEKVFGDKFQLEIQSVSSVELYRNISAIVHRAAVQFDALTVKTVLTPSNFQSYYFEREVAQENFMFHVPVSYADAMLRKNFVHFLNYFYNRIMKADRSLFTSNHFLYTLVHGLYDY